MCSHALSVMARRRSVPSPPRRTKPPPHRRHAALGRQVMMLWTGTLRLLLVEGVPRKQRRWWQAVSMEAPCSLTLGLGPPGGQRQLYL